MNEKEKLEQIKKIIGEEEKKEVKEIKKSSFSKLFINIIISIIFIVGLIGVFKNSPVEIKKYVDFVKSFGVVFVPLIVAVAGGRVAKNYMNVKGNNK